MRHSISVEVNWNLQQWTTTEKKQGMAGAIPGHHGPPPLPRQTSAPLADIILPTRCARIHVNLRLLILRPSSNDRGGHDYC